MSVWNLSCGERLELVCFHGLELVCSQDTLVSWFGFGLVPVVFARLHVCQTAPFEQMGSDKKSTSLMRDSKLSL